MASGVVVEKNSSDTKPLSFPLAEEKKIYVQYNVNLKKKSSVLQSGRRLPTSALLVQTGK